MLAMVAFANLGEYEAIEPTFNFQLLDTSRAFWKGRAYKSRLDGTRDEHDDVMMVVFQL
jgi:hypothetical protein